MSNQSPEPSQWQAPAPVSIWRFNLVHELVAATAGVLTLLAGSWFVMNQLEKRYLQLHQSDAERVGQLLQEHLLEARTKLDHFVTVPAERQRDASQLLLPVFSDLYRLDSSLNVIAVLKASEGSQVFSGFSFAGSHIEPYLRQPTTSGMVSSTIERGVEDERPSIYFTGTDRAGGRLLARLNLSYLQGFLSRYQRASGLPQLLVNRRGFVMLTSDPKLLVPAVDFYQAASKTISARSFQQNDQRWLPLVTNRSGLGGHIVTLIPTDRLEAQRELVWWATLTVAGLALLVLIWKNRRLHQLLFNPVAEFSNQIERLRSNVAKGDLRPLEGVMAPYRFQEMAQIEASFEALIDTIRERDSTLQQKLRTSLTAAAIAHEINLPLSTIRLRCLQADQQLRGGDLHGADLQELVQAIQADSQQVSSVIEKMRMLLRNVQTELLPIKVDVVVSSTLTFLKRQLREQQVQLRCVGLENAENLMVNGDAVQLQMALSNLLRNAIEAVAERPAAQREVALTLRRDGDQVFLGVADSGPGFSVDPETDTLMRSSKPTGSGLGLFVARTALSNHHGCLRIGRSAELGGAELWMQLPLMTSEANDRRCGTCGHNGDGPIEL